MQKTRFLPLLAILAPVLLAACGSPAASATPAGPPGADTPPAPDATLLAATRQPSEDTTPGPSPTPGLPEGWVEIEGPEQGLVIAGPADWDARPEDDHTLSLREPGGDGWVQISVLDEATAGAWGLDYQAGMPPADVLDALLGALREDGDFTAPRPVETRDAHPALASEGLYHVMEERLFVGVVGLPERAVVVTGHGAEATDNPDADWARLRPIYERVLWGVRQP